jgi:O-antigen ligase
MSFDRIIPPDSWSRLGKLGSPGAGSPPTRLDPAMRRFAALGALLLLVCLWLAARGDYLMLLAPVALLGAAWVLLRQPDAATPLFAFLLYTNASAVAVQIHGAPYIFAAALPGLLLIPIFRDLVLRREKPVVTAALPLFVGFLAVQFIGALNAIRPDESMADMTTTLLEGFLLYLLVTNAIRTLPVVRQVLWSLIAAGAFMGAIVGFQHLTGSYENDFGGFARVDVSGMGFVLNAATEQRQPRVGGPLGMPNRFAQIMVILIPIALLQFQASRGRRAKLAAAASVGLIMVGFSLGFSRGAAVGLGATFLLMIAMGHVNLRQLAVAGIAFVAMVLVVPQYAVRLASIVKVADLATTAGGQGLGDADSSTQGRITEMVAGMLIFADHPLIGVGPAMYPEHYVTYARVAGGRVRPNTREAHSLPLHVAAEHGMIGLTLFGAIFLVTMRALLRARRKLRESQPELSRLASGVFLAVVAFALTSVFLHASFIRYQWFLLAVAGATGRVLLQQQGAAPGQAVRLVQVRDANPPATPLLSD